MSRFLTLCFASICLFGCATGDDGQHDQGLAPFGAPATLPNSLADIENCSEPVLMVVLGEVSQTGFAPTPDGRSYGTELRESGLYERFGGHYLLGYPPLETFEHPLPENAFTLVAQWPCLEAAQGFYYSEEYQDIISLRSQAGRFQFTIYPKRSLEDMYWMKDESE